MRARTTPERTWGRVLLCLVPLALGACADGSGDAAAGATRAEPCAAGTSPAYGALDLESGDVRWSVCSPAEAYRTVIGASEDLVLVLESSDTGSAQTIALDASDGAERWRVSTARGPGSVPPGPVDGSGVAVVETDVEGTPFVMGVEADDGAERWRIGPGESVLGSADDVVVVTGASGLMTTTTGGAAAAPRPDGGLRGIDRTTGEERWANDVSFRDASGVGVARGAAAVVGSTLAVPSGSALTGVDLSDGEVLWTAPQVDHPAAADGVIVGSDGSQSGQRTVRALDAETGEQRWSAAGRPSYGDLWAVGDGVVVVLTDGAELVAYELATGDERWRARRSNVEPQLVADSAVVLLWEGELAVRSTSDGSQRWAATEPFRSPLMNSVGTNGSSVFVAVNSLPWGD